MSNLLSPIQRYAFRQRVKALAHRHTRQPVLSQLLGNFSFPSMGSRVERYMRATSLSGLISSLTLVLYLPCSEVCLPLRAGASTQRFHAGHAECAPHSRGCIPAVCRETAHVFHRIVQVTHLVQLRPVCGFRLGIPGLYTNRHAVSYFTELLGGIPLSRHYPPVPLTFGKGIRTTVQ